MLEFFRRLFVSDFMPHGHCYFWEPGVLWLNVASDTLIAAAYYAIPFVLFSFARRRKDLGFQWIFVAFGFFILACGSTHLMAVWTVWNGTYRLDGIIKAITAVSSIATAALLVPLVPKLVALPSPMELKRANEGLATEIQERKSAEENVRRMNAELEQRVAGRTAELREANQRLSAANSELRDEMERRRAVEAQLVQAQKMEAIGRLAGGIAHDFNNLLTIMLGYTQIALDDTDESAPLHGQLEEVRNAAMRATSLVQQLLAFSRKQVLQPRVIDLNLTISSFETMLRRLLGDDIEFLTVLRPGLNCVKADPSQIEQVIMNLAVNARDAMPNGGKLSIETDNVHLDEAYCREHVGVTPGEYVMLAVSDTGCGMDEETKARIFEPFFTTKEPGKGTGLGLSTVFGIVKQSGGSIWVYSERGHGSTFKVYLPRVAEAGEEAPRGEAASRRGSETVLICEDDEKIRALARTIVAAQGYTVFEAGGANEALLFQSRYTGPIHLLLTDVVMPQMNGRELAQRLRASLPNLKVLFMSGYTQDAITSQGTLGPGIEFIQKPFTPEALSNKIRDVLDS